MQKMKCRDCGQLVDKNDEFQCSQCRQRAFTKYQEQVSIHDYDSLTDYWGIRNPKEEDKEKAIKEFLAKKDYEDSFRERITFIIESKDWWYFQLFGIGAGGYFMNKETGLLQHKPSFKPPGMAMFFYERELQKKNKA